ncbi:MAG: hypothetical protein K8R69_04010, partial [Deltaproteobacteria bacterium]|nr:hypothetical protein [Deltaproteobacteria bacterium]
MSEEIPQPIASLLAKRGSLATLDKLFGEASYRVYYRATMVGGETYIVMQMPPGKQSASEEISNYEGPKLEPPFLNMARWLEKVGLPAPKIIDVDLASGLILLQD